MSRPKPVFAAVLLSSGLLLSQLAFGQATQQSFRGDFPEINTVPVRADIVGEGDAPTIVTGANGTPALRITYDGQNSQNNGVAFNQLFSGDYSSLTASFQIRVDGIDANADGFGWAYVNTDNFGTNTATVNPNWGLAEEPNVAGSLGIGFDTWHNDGLDPQPGVNGPSPNSVSLHFDGNTIQQLDFSTVGDDLFFESGNPIDVEVGIFPAGTGSNVNVVLRDSILNTIYTPFENVNIPGLTPYDGRMAFRGRTGGANSDQEVDNIQLEVVPTNGGAPQFFTEDFNSFDLGALPGIDENPATLIGGSNYTLAQLGTDPGGELRSDAGPGMQDGFLRIAHEVQGNNNVVAFDKTSQQNTVDVEASFDFRITDNGALGRADGFSFLLIPTDLFGDTGTDMLPDLNPQEEGNVEFGLGVSFDTFDSGDENTSEPNIGNHISLHWNNGIVGGDRTQCGMIEGCVILDRTTEFDLVNGEWNTADVDVDLVAGGAEVTVTVTDGSDGSQHVIFDDVFIAGYEFPFGSRVAFGARTGGAADNFDLDNILVQWDGDERVEPEPSGLVCDADGDGDCQADDLAALFAQSGTAGSLDLDGSGIVDGNDIDEWLAAASDSNNPGKNDPDDIYVIGDANLDGNVNSVDLGLLLNNFNAEGGVNFGSGDLNLDNVVNSVDLGLLLNNFGSTSASASAVPEPQMGIWLLASMILLTLRRRS